MILVDPIREYANGPRGWRFWCHMMSDDLTDAGLQELHAMATALGIRQRFQDNPRHPHYDLPPHKREEAIALGATPVSSKEMVRRCSRLFAVPSSGLATGET